MNAALWTRLSIVVLIAVPPVIFVLFLRDAAALVRGLGAGADDPERSGPGSRSGGA